VLSWAICPIWQAAVQPLRFFIIITHENTKRRITMPVFKEGNMLQAPGYIIVTTSSFLTSEKKLVMGAGVARDLKIKVPGIDQAFGELIYTLCKHLGRYGLIFHDRYGAFQVRYRFNDKARADLIRFSAAALKGAAINNREEIFNLNYPGIGNGGLKEYEVRPILEVLPENVCVWKKREVYYGIYP
jgi:hypothetical protein